MLRKSSRKRKNSVKPAPQNVKLLNWQKKSKLKGRQPAACEVGLLCEIA